MSSSTYPVRSRIVLAVFSCVAFAFMADARNQDPLPGTVPLALFVWYVFSIRPTPAPGFRQQAWLLVGTSAAVIVFAAVPTGDYAGATPTFWAMIPSIVVMWVGLLMVPWDLKWAPEIFGTGYAWTILLPWVVAAWEVGSAMGIGASAVLLLYPINLVWILPSVWQSGEAAGQRVGSVVAGLTDDQAE